MTRFLRVGIAAVVMAALALPTVASAQQSEPYVYVAQGEPKGSFDPPADAGWLMLVGDLTAMPAMALAARLPPAWMVASSPNADPRRCAGASAATAECSAVSTQPIARPAAANGSASSGTLVVSTVKPR